MDLKEVKEREWLWNHIVKENRNNQRHKLRDRDTCLPRLLGDGYKRSEIVCSEENSQSDALTTRLDLIRTRLDLISIG